MTYPTLITAPLRETLANLKHDSIVIIFWPLSLCHHHNIIRNCFLTFLSFPKLHSATLWLNVVCFLYMYLTFLNLIIGIDLLFVDSRLYGLLAISLRWKHKMEKSETNLRWRHTVEKSETNAINVTLHLYGQAIWGTTTIWPSDESSEIWLQSSCKICPVMTF